jgi:hypothetical protein
MNEVEKLYTNVLESGDRTRAMQRLRVPPLEEKQPRIVTFRLGMFLGMIYKNIVLTHHFQKLLSRKPSRTFFPCAMSTS